MAPHFLTTRAGEELVLLTRREYDQLLARAVGRPYNTGSPAPAARPGSSDGGGKRPQWLARGIEAGDSPLKAARKRKGLTQAWLGRQIGVNQSHVSAAELGKKRLSPDALAAAAASLGVKAAWLEA